MARRRDGIRRGSRRTFSGLLITVALHGVIFMAVAAAHNKPEGPLIVPRDFVQAEMVKLGKPRDKFWLPKAPTAPPPPPPDAIKLSDDPNAKPAEAPKLEDPKTSKEVRRALERAQKLGALAMPEEPEEGDLKGSSKGTASQATGDPYIATIKGMLLENYNLPAGMNADQIPNPPEIRFQIGASDGILSGIKLLKSSGNPLVDDACVSAAQLTRRVPQPPAGSKVRGLIVACEK